MIERERIGELVRNAAELNRRYYEGLLKLSLDYLSDVSKVMLRGVREPAERSAASGRSAAQGRTQSRAGGTSSSPRGSLSAQGRMDGPEPATPTLVLEAEAGRSAVGFFLVHNVSGRAVSAIPRAENCIGPDGLPGSIEIAFAPTKIDLGPGEQMTVQVAAAVDDGVEAGVPYRTRLTVPGLADAGIPAVVRRRHPVNTPAAAVAVAPSADGSPTSEGADPPSASSAARAKPTRAQSGRAKSARSKTASPRKKTARRRAKKKKST